MEDSEVRWGDEWLETQGLQSVTTGTNVCIVFRLPDLLSRTLAWSFAFMIKGPLGPMTNASLGHLSLSESLFPFPREKDDNTFLWNEEGMQERAASPFKGLVFWQVEVRSCRIHGQKWFSVWVMTGLVALRVLSPFLATTRWLPPPSQILCLCSGLVMG